MNDNTKNKLKWIAIILLGLLISYSILLTRNHIKLKKDMNVTLKNLSDLRKITSTTPTIKLQEVLRDTVKLPGDSIPIYYTKYIDKPYLDKNTLDKIAISDTTINKLLKALDLKTKEVNNITTLYTSTRAENLKLKENDNKLFEYRDRYITLTIDDTNKVVKNINIKNDLSLVDHWYRKWFLSPKRYYTSIATESPYLNIDSINKIRKQQPITKFSMYLDNRYYNNLNKFNDGFMLSTINAEINPDNTLSFYGGVGIKTNMVYIETIMVAGVKINLWRIKR